jgi:hypothetical protein
MKANVRVTGRQGAALISALSLAVLPITSAPRAEDMTPEAAHAIAVDAYVYFYPLVTMDVTRRQLTNMEAGKTEFGGPMNTFVNVKAFPSADARAVVRPNFDTLYSSGWLDLTSGPVIVSAPDTAGRFYPMYSRLPDRARRALRPRISCWPRRVGHPERSCRAACSASTRRHHMSG